MLTISEDIDQSIRILEKNEHITYKQAIHLVLKKGLEGILAAEASPGYAVQSFDAGFQIGVDLGSLNRLADGLEDDL